MTHTIITLKVDGTRTSKFHKPTLEVLQAEVGGYIESLPHFTTFEGRRCIAYCDEEGRLKGLAYNKIASMAWHKALKYKYSRAGVCGTVVITIKGEHKCEAISL